MELIPRPTPLPGDIDGWLASFGESFLMRLDIAQRDDAISQIRDSLRPMLMNEEGIWIADYVRLRFAATVPV
jgi:hypothetical protein